MVDNNQRVYLVILRHEGPCVSYENFQHCKLILNAVGLQRESDHVPCPSHRHVFVWRWWEMARHGQWAKCITDRAPWNSLRDACGAQARWASATRAAQSKGTICMVWLWVHSSFTWAMHLGGGKRQQSLFASKLTLCRHCWNRWLFCTHYGTFFPLSYMIVRFLFRLLLLKGGSVPNSNNGINKVWECQSLHWDSQCIPSLGKFLRKLFVNLSQDP